MKKMCCVNTNVPGISLVLFFTKESAIELESGKYAGKEFLLKLEGQDSEQVTLTEFKEHGGKDPFPPTMMDTMLHESFGNGMVTSVLEKNQVTGDFIPGEFKEGDLPMETWILISPVK